MSAYGKTISNGFLWARVKVIGDPAVIYEPRVIVIS